jgi:uncharacterized membrane protein
MKRFYYIWEKLNSSFWFIPLLILLFAMSAAIYFLHLDSVNDFDPEGVWSYFYAGSADSARSILSTIAGAMIGVAGTTFSITIVALTLASSQFGSRLLRNFMYDKVNQIVLGTYIATFVYCLMVLNAVRHSELESFVPKISVMAAILAAILNIILLILFFHHIAISIQSDKVISDISEAMSGNMKKLFPSPVGKEVEEKAAPSVEQLRKKFLYRHEVLCTSSGYLQSMDLDYLLKVSRDSDAMAYLPHRPGSYLVEDTMLMEVFSHQQLDERIEELCQSAYITGKVRTSLQDVEFSIHQIVEIAGRALSPGVNDPYTAITCIDNLSSILCYLSLAAFPSAGRYDEEGVLRLLTSPLTFEGMLDAAYHQIRQYAANNPAVLIRLLEALSRIYRHAESASRKKAVEKHANMVLSVGERSFDEPHDLEDLKQRWIVT